MQVQPTLLAVNNAPPVLAGRASAEPAEAAPAEPVFGSFYISPLLRFDSRAFTLLFQLRDSQSGDVTRQFPAESVVKALRQNPEPIPELLGAGNDASEEPVVRAPQGEQVETQSLPTTTTGSGGSEPAPVVVGSVGQSNGAPQAGSTATSASPQLAPGAGSVNFVA